MQNLLFVFHLEPLSSLLMFIAAVTIYYGTKSLVFEYKRSIWRAR